MSEKEMRELDVEIAKLVFGLVYSNFQWFAGDHGPSVYHKLPKYSEDPAAAMQVFLACWKLDSGSLSEWLKLNEPTPENICRKAKSMFQKV